MLSVETTQYQILPQGYFAEKWFIAVARQLKIIAKNPSLDLVKPVLKTYRLIDGFKAPCFSTISLYSL